MTKDEILVYGMIVQADIFVDGHGTNEADEELLQKALSKIYGVTEETPKEELEKLEKQLEEDKQALAIKFREKIQQFLKSE